MSKNTRKLGFNYFNKPEYLTSKYVNEWLPVLKQLGASFVVFRGGYERSIPEDVFISAVGNELEPIVHLDAELPVTRKLNDVILIMDAYAKWGVKTIIFGDKPNTKGAWHEAGWHYENLVDHFLDRFIPMANYAVRVGINPVLSPMQPGGDYWDTAFIELIMLGLKRRKLSSILEKLVLSSYGYTCNKPLSWGKGGPERWSASKPYLTPEGQEDQLGFHNYQWVQAHAKRNIGEQLPVMVLEAGNPGLSSEIVDKDKTLEDIQRIFRALLNIQQSEVEDSGAVPDLDASVLGCIFDLNTIDQAVDNHLNPDILKSLFSGYQTSPEKTINVEGQRKGISHYLLLPSHKSGVSDAVLNKVRPIIKKIRPTIGFSINEASMAQKVMVYPDPLGITDEQINRLRAAGCSVEILPDSGIEIATYIQE